MREKKPFAGLKVVELTTYLAAPTGGRILADWGADVVKVEPPKPDPWRAYGKSFGTPISDDENPVFDIPNAGKRGLVLNLKEPKGMEAFHKLLAEADVFITNNRLAPLKAMELDYNTLKTKYPKLIYGIITGYGEQGPDVAKPGFDTVAYWGHGGFIGDLMLDEEGCYPIYTPAGVADLFCGTLLFGGISAALYAREKTGKGDKISLSLFGAAVWSMGIMNTIVQDKFKYKYPKKRSESSAMAVSYKCKDGEWVMISALEYDRQFPVLCKILGLEHLIGSDEYKDWPSMLIPENKAKLLELFEEKFAERDSAEIIKALTGGDIVNSRLRHFKEIYKDEQVRANHFGDEVTFRSGGTAWLPRPCIQSDNLGIPDYISGPSHGMNSKEILREVGYSEQDIESMLSGNITKQK